MPKKGEFKTNAKPRSVQQRAFTSQPAEKKRRAARNKARRQLESEGRVRKGDGKDVDHRDGNPLNNARGNQRVLPRSTNRSQGGAQAGKRKKPFRRSRRSHR